MHKPQIMIKTFFLSVHMTNCHFWKRKAKNCVYLKENWELSEKRPTPTGLIRETKAFVEKLDSSLSLDHLSIGKRCRGSNDIMVSSCFSSSLIIFVYCAPFCHIALHCIAKITRKLQNKISPIFYMMK